MKRGLRAWLLKKKKKIKKRKRMLVLGDSALVLITVSQGEQSMSGFRRKMIA